MVSRDLQRIRNIRATGVRKHAVDAVMDAAAIEKRKVAQAEKFRSETKKINTERREVSKQFEIGQQVTDGRYHGIVKRIDPKTGDVYVKFGARVVKVNPSMLTPS